MKPHFIIIGAMKSATTTLHDQLAAQPGIFMSTPKEPNFFSDEAQWMRGLDWYWGLFAGAKEGDVCGESSTHYTKLPTHARTVDRLGEHVPDAKFVYVMRHPIDRLISHYVHEWTQRVIDVPLASALDAHPELVQYGQYAMQLKPYFDRFGRERVLPVFFDRLNEHPQAELDRVCEFIGYAGKPTWRDLPPANVSGERMRKSKLRDLLVELPVLATLRRRFVPKRLRERIKALWMMKERPALGEAERRRLVALFDPDLAALGRALGIELSCDTFVERTRDEPFAFVAGRR